MTKKNKESLASLNTFPSHIDKKIDKTYDRSTNAERRTRAQKLVNMDRWTNGLINYTDTKAFVGFS
jgi:hypothetical protein